MSIGSGNVTIEFVGKDGQVEERQLKPSISAMRRISSKHGGLRQAIEKIERLDIDAVVDILEAGLGTPQTVKAREELLEATYRTGLSSDTGRIAEQCVSFVITLLRGGRPLPPPGTTEPSEGEPNPTERPS
jgi:hypothetical protein